jgi:hypothetical protein
MSTDTNGLLVYLALVITFSIIAHSFGRRFWANCAALAVVCSVINIGYEVVTHDFRIRPSDAVFWLPMLFVYGAAIALPVALLIGLPFVGFRRRRKTI